MNEPLTSVVIAVYNGEKYLQAAIESVLAQTHPAPDVIVVDDGSTDNSAAIARSFGHSLRCECQPHSGLGAAMNHGISLAQGQFLAFLDADDLWPEDKLARQHHAFAQDASLDMVFGHITQFLSPELDDAAKARIYCPPDPMPGYSTGTMLIKRESFHRVGPFATVWQVGVFVDWYLKATEAGLKSIMLPDVLLYRRLHTTNVGIVHRDSRADLLRILKASLDRRRKAASSDEGD
jgi:glycosyltransferase involved in cell wall biosynthesis